ncbi:MAG: ABC transporter permease subunit [Phycisphaeraceae bacterium]|nr:ABC transporter permease subunit [Phycisphaeraceae bacterium]MCW5769668.1 ABC transporter permease subunit [Phycisphaeraceae bacterium]
MQTTVSLTSPLSRPPHTLVTVAWIGVRELKDAIGTRWFTLYTLAFAALGLGVSFVSASGSGGSGLSGFGRTSAGLINLVLLVVPLMALSAGAASIASDRERGMLAYLLAQPVTPVELLLGKFVGLAVALLACILLGLGLCAMVVGFKGGALNASSIAWLAGLSFLLALGMLGTGMLISVVTRRASVATGTAVFIWLVLVFGTDLALMAGTLTFRLRIEELFALSLINPLQVFKMWSLHAIDSTLDVLGPAALYAVEEHGESLHAIFGLCLSAWILAPLTLACVLFSRKGVS